MKPQAALRICGFLALAVPVICGGRDAAGPQSSAVAPGGKVDPGFSLQDLSYSGPACKGAKSPKEFDDYLSGSNAWKPRTSEGPYRGGSLRRARDAATGDSLEDLLPEGSPGPGTALPSLSMTVYASDQDEKPSLDTPIPVLWVDLDGDGICDAVATSYSGTGAFGHTWIYIFLQTPGGFRLVDFTPADSETKGVGYQPAALVPVWIKGDRRPFLVLRQDINLVASGWVASLPRPPANLRGAGDEYGLRSAIRWEPESQSWRVYSSGMLQLQPVGQLLARFLSENPPPDSGKKYCSGFDFLCIEPH